MLVIMDLFFATSNLHKFKEAERIFARSAPTGFFRLGHFAFAHREIRSDDSGEISLEAVAAAYALLKKPVFVEDTGLFINALNGFPGTYSAWVQQKIGNAGLLKLLKGEKERSARFETVVSFTHDGKEIVSFRGVCDGSIAEEEVGNGGFGYDPVFIPVGHEQTFAENIELKNNISHRYKSISLFIDYLKNSHIYGTESGVKR